MIESVYEIIHRHIQHAPVDVYGMARDLGIKVSQKWWENNRSGSIERIGDQYEISVNYFHHENRKRFTVAHEIGHFVLHKDVLDENKHIVDNREGNTTLYRDENIPGHLETEANKFAASILMPTDLIKRLHQEGYQTPQALAERLKVSEGAMWHRLGNMGALQPLPGHTEQIRQPV